MKREKAGYSVQSVLKVFVLLETLANEDVCAVAVAIKDYAGKVVCALTMLAPSFRMLQERLEKEIIPSMLEGAEILSQKFGYAKLPAIA